MDSDELVTAIRTDAFLPTADSTFTAARLLIEATETLYSLVERAVVSSAGGYWLREYPYTTVSGQTRYRMPIRAVTGIAASVKLGAVGEEGVPVPGRNYRFLGDYVVFRTAPDAGQQLTIEYHLRPNRIVTTQTAGRITAIDTSTNTVTVNSVPNRMLGSGAPASINALPPIYLDIVKPNGWHQPSVAQYIGFVVGSDVTFDPAADFSDVEVGDYVRAADESDWPGLPVDFHRMLATLTAARVLTAKKAHEASAALISSAQPVMERFLDLITPRVKDAPPVVKPSYGILRRRGRVYGSLPR